MLYITLINDKLYSSLRNLIGYLPLYLFNNDGNFIEVLSKSIFKFLVPIGYFANPNVAIPFTASYGDNFMHDKDNLVLPALYPIQQRVVQEISIDCSKKRKENRPLYTTLHLACGFGKTVIGGFLIGSHKKRAIVCVPNKLILGQWEPIIKSLNVTYYISYSGVSKLLKILETKQFSILAIVDKHLYNKQFCEYITKNFDVFLVDESHLYNLLNASAMTRFLCYYPPKICYFLTATPRQQNRLYCNSVISVVKLSELKKLVYTITEFYPEYTSSSVANYVKQLYLPANKYHLYTEKILAEDIYRDKTIIATLLKTLKNETRILVITRLRSHMFKLYTELYAALGDLIFIGDAKKKDINQTIELLRRLDKFIFISTLQYAGTGLDIPNLNCLFICNIILNSMQTKQVMGRICRENSTTSERVIYLFGNTSIKEIKSLVGTFTQKLIKTAKELGFREILEIAE